MKALFVCNMNQNRSLTAEKLFEDRFETKSVGIYRNQMTKHDLDWADIIFVMENWQRAEIGRVYPREYLNKRILSLDIPDIYHFDQPELIRLLETQMEKMFARRF